MTTIILRMSALLLMLVTGGMVIAMGVGTTQPGYTIAAHVYDTDQDTRLLMLIDTHTRLTHPVMMPFIARRDVFFSPDGERVLIPHGVGDQTQMAVFDVQNGGLIYESPPEYIDCNPDLYDFRWSSDNEKITFRCRSYELPEAHLINLSTGETKQISPEPVYAVWWSPDSQLILLQTNYRLDIYDVTVGETTQLAEERTAIGASSWSPDGTQIVYIFNDSLRLVDFASGNQRIIHGGRLLSHWPIWSPDGRKIALVDYELRRPITIDMTTGERFIIDGGDLKIDSVVELTWSPMGDRFLIYDNWSLVLYDTVGEYIRLLSSDRIADYDFSSDGRFIAFATDASMLFAYDSQQDTIFNQWEVGSVQTLQWMPGADVQAVTYIQRNFENSAQAPLQLYWLDINSDAPQRLLDPHYSVINYTFWSRNND